MKEKHISNLETRKKIYNFILRCPGLHLRELSRELKIPITTLNYHLRHLEKRGFIEINPEKRYKRVYATKNIGIMSKKLIVAIRQKTALDILLYISLSFSASQAELSNELELSPTTIAKHLKRLVKLGIIEPTPVKEGVFCTSHKNKVIIERSSYGREKIYRLTRSTNPDTHLGALLEEILTRYNKGISDDNVRLALEYVDIVNPERKLPKKIKNRKDYMNRLEKKLWEIFPHPYHI